MICVVFIEIFSKQSQGIVYEFSFEKGQTNTYG